MKTEDLILIGSLALVGFVAWKVFSGQKTGAASSSSGLTMNYHPWYGIVGDKNPWPQNRYWE